MRPSDLRARLAQFPQIDLGHEQTPLAPLPRLTNRLVGPHLWIKRDDGIGPAMGGNKARKLAFLLAQAQQQGKRKVVTFGGLQSNHARMTAAACARLGLTAHLFFFEKRPLTLRGNLLLDDLLGARLHFIPFGSSDEPTMTLETTNRLVRLVSLLRVGPGAYFMPVGGHTALGCLGYVAAAVELHEQLTAAGVNLSRATVLTAVGTGGTLAGLMAGFHLLQSPVRLLGIDVGKLWRAFPASIAQLAVDICGLLQRPFSFSAAQVPLMEGRYVGPGYGRVTPGGVAAIRTLAQSEGILLDPVYTGKAFAGLLDLVANGRFTAADHVIFLHTGGHPGLWASCLS